MNQKKASARLKFGLGLLDTVLVLVISGSLLVFILLLSGKQIQKLTPLTEIIGEKNIGVLGSIVLSFLVWFWRAQYRGLIPMPNYFAWILIFTVLMSLAVYFLTPQTKPNVVIQPNPIEKRTQNDKRQKKIIPPPNEIIQPPIEKFKITGIVKSVDGRPVDSVMVYIKNNNVTYTNSQGCFALNFPSENGQIVNVHFDKYGYKTRNDDFTIPHNEDIEVVLTNSK